jgi:hypothetical protein
LQSSTIPGQVFILAGVLGQGLAAAFVLDGLEAVAGSVIGARGESLVDGPSAA